MTEISKDLAPESFKLTGEEKEALRMVALHHPKTSLDDERIAGEATERAAKAGVRDPIPETLLLRDKPTK